MIPLPGGPASARPLHFIWIADCSGSMAGAKIQTLNRAIREVIPHMQGIARQNSHAQVLVRAVAFSSGARWHVGTPTPVDQFNWVDLQAGGVTDMGKALALVASQLQKPPMPERSLPPVLVLISDGYPTDDYNSGLKSLLAEPWGDKAVRIAIGIGQDAADARAQEVFKRFIGPFSELPVLQANNAETLVNFIKWASTAIKISSTPQAQAYNQPDYNAPTQPVPPPTPASGPDVW